MILIGVSVLYEYPDILLKRPQTVHYWRQSDCASLALNYYQHGMKFFEPQTHNLTSNNGTSGNTCTSEVPILYYAAAGLYHLFGYHEFLYRLLNTLLFLTGLYYLFKLFSNVLKSQFWSTLFSLLFFTSPVLVYYGNNFLSNSTALSMVFIGWYHFYAFYKQKETRSLYISMVFFLLAGCFKITGLLSVFAIMGLFIWERIPFLNNKNSHKLFLNGWKHLLPFLILFCIIGAWVWFAVSYNDQYNSKYFSTRTFPLWEMDQVGIDYVINKVSGMWMTQYFHGGVLLFFAVSFIYMLLYNKRFELLWIRTSLLLFIGVLAYIVLQFYTFGDHDYYTINLNILPLIITLGIANYATKHKATTMAKNGVKIAFFCCLLISMFHAKAKVHERYYGWWSEYEFKKDIHEITPYLRSIGISPNDRVISIPDQSHLTLYLMNQKGWTEYSDMRLHEEQPVKYNRNEGSIQHCIDNGAKYLIVNGIQELIKRPHFMTYASNLIGRYNNVLIFDLINREKNFSVKERAIKEKIFFDLENHATFINQFKSMHEITFYDENLKINEDDAYSGIRAAELNKDNQYGMTVKFGTVSYGESFKISVMRKKSENNNSTLVASGPTNERLYYKECKVSPAEKAGWEKLTMKFFIETNMHERDLKVYLYCSNDNSAVFDDMEIIWYEKFDYDAPSFKSNVK